jgi:hypothetical protein
MRSWVACVVVAGCVSTTSRVTVPAVPTPITIAVEGDCDDARRAYPTATRCDSETSVSGVTYAVGITAVVVVTALILLVRAGGPDP